jgi:hypothetical protein
MNKLNREWHVSHRMPQRATLEQRIDWHLEHQRHCGCRGIPERIREAIERRKANSAADPR